MLVGRKKKSESASSLNRLGVNKVRSGLTIFFILLITGGLIYWVWFTGKKAEETVTVTMLKSPMYRNQIFTEDDLMPYDMLKGEFDKYSIRNKNGTVTQRLVLWDDHSKVIGYFAAYPIMGETLLEYRSLVKERTDNSDSVLYNFPGKEIVQLNVSAQDLTAFKALIQPGDKINVDAIYSEKDKVQVADGYGGTTVEEVEVYKSEPLFTNILIADMINNSGESVLDMFANYNNLTTFEQANLDNSEEWKTKTEPKSLLVALSPDEKERYNKFLSKSNITFKVSLPQRMA